MTDRVSPEIFSKRHSAGLSPEHLRSAFCFHCYSEHSEIGVVMTGYCVHSLYRAYDMGRLELCALECREWAWGFLLALFGETRTSFAVVGRYPWNKLQ